MGIKVSDTQQSGYFNSLDQYRYSRKAVVSLSYNFGNKKLQKARNIEGAAGDIKSRTGGN